MKNMTNIKVTVEYEVPKTSKFDALLSEYAVAKKIADETESYYKPLAEAAEEAKFDAILHKLETIKYYAQQISKLSNDDAVWIRATIPYSERNDTDYMQGSGDFTVEYFSKESDHFRIRWGGVLFTKEVFDRARCNFCKGSKNVIGNWDKWKVYQRLEDDAIRKLNNLIQKQMKRKQDHINRLNNVQGGM
jgi:hypothetical protein